MRKYSVLIEADQCIMTPKERRGYALKIKLADQEFKTEIIKERNDASGVIGTNFNRWGRRSDVLHWEFPYNTFEGMGDFFVYLVDRNGKNISYAKFKAKDFQDVNPKLTWI